MYLKLQEGYKMGMLMCTLQGKFTHKKGGNNVLSAFRSGSVSTPLGTTDREKQREETILMLFEGLAHSNDEMHLEEVSVSDFSAICQLPFIVHYTAAVVLTVTRPYGGWNATEMMTQQKFW